MATGVLGVLSSAFAAGATGVVAWENTFRPDPAEIGPSSVIAAAQLADGTRLAVVYAYPDFIAARYDADGNQIGTTHFTSPPYYIWKVAIDPFGGIFLATYPNAFGGPILPGDFWLNKYDAFTGRPLWPRPQLIGAGDSYENEPRALLIDSAGDVIASIGGQPAALIKFDGRSGEPLWGPVGVPNAYEAALDGSGNVVLAGTDGTDFHLAKFASSNGALLWERHDPDHDFDLKFVGVDPWGGVLVAGEVDTFDRGVEVSRYNGISGARIWGPVTYSVPGDGTTRLASAAVGADGGLVVAGTASPTGSVEYFLARFLGASGTRLWTAHLPPDPNQHSAPTLHLTGNGDAIFHATTHTGQSTTDLKAWRFDGGTGVVLWGPEIMTGSSIPVGIVTSAGSFFGATVDYQTEEDEVEAVLFERNGDTGQFEWGPTLFTGLARGSAFLSDLATTPDGHIVATGSVSRADGAAFATLKYDRDTGATLWGPIFFESDFYSSFQPWQIAIDAAGNVFVAGDAWLPDHSLAVVKHDGATGAILWSASLGDFTTRGLEIDPSGNPVVIGYFQTDTFAASTFKLSGVDGSIVWGPKVYDTDGSDFAESLVVDAGGAVYVSGRSFGGTSDEPGFLVKYSAAGALAWGPVNDPGTTPASLVLDASGNPVVSGSGSGGIRVVKRSSANGSVLWGPIVVGVNGGGFGGSLARDASDNFFVTGSVSSQATRSDYLIFKLRGSDGLVVWGPVTFNGAPNLNDVPAGVVLDPDGSPIVSGRTELIRRYYGSATLKYDGATGILLWGPVIRELELDSRVSGLAASGDMVYVGATRNAGYLVTAIGESVGIGAMPEDVVPAVCGEPYDVDLIAENATSPTWSLVSGSLPPGITLSVGGHLVGTPEAEGVFTFRVQVSDGPAGSAARDFTLIVVGGSFVPVLVQVQADCSVTLSVSGSYDTYQWLPGGETTSTITVSPTEVTTYGALLSDASGCLSRGTATIVPTELVDPDCLAPTLVSVSPDSGPSGPGTTLTLAGTKFQTGAAVFVGGQAAADVVVESEEQVMADTPLLAPGTLNDVFIVNPDNGLAFLAGAYATDFLDVPPSDPFHESILAMLRNGITAGCGNGNYCRNSGVTRAQMAVFLLKASLGSAYVPPPAVGLFADVGTFGFAADWIEDLYNRGITGGCATNPPSYCPDSIVTRAQMAIFLLKTEHGSAYVPPACTGIFADVACAPTPAFAVDWIEQIYDDGITGGCATSPLRYCPTSGATRGQMAVFLDLTFDLP